MAAQRELCGSGAADFRALGHPQEISRYPHPDKPKITIVAGLGHTDQATRDRLQKSPVLVARVKSSNA